MASQEAVFGELWRWVMSSGADAPECGEAPAQPAR
jgi:hypothetical protein